MSKESQDLRGVTLKRAGEIIGGDKPLSVRTISAMIKRGDLNAYGERGGRRVTTRSIDAYIDGNRHQDITSLAPKQDAAIPRRTPKGGWKT